MSNFNNHIEIPDEINTIGKRIVNCAYKVHSKLGPGLLEVVYEKCLYHELKKNGLSINQQVNIPIIYDDLIIKDALRIDLLVENCIIIELKAVETVLPVHEAQIISYLKLTENRLGYLINFNVPLIKNGIKRFIN